MGFRVVFFIYIFMNLYVVGGHLQESVLWVLGIVLRLPGLASVPSATEPSCRPWNWCWYKVSGAIGLGKVQVHTPGMHEVPGAG